jgi:multicomponent Na+:H+ antiporter subunit D
MVKASLFICAGILLHMFQSVDEFELQGAGQKMPWTGLLVLLGALGLTSIPPFLNFLGEAQIDSGMESSHLRWLSVIIIFSAALTSAAVLRVGCRVFLGWGERDEDAKSAAARIPMQRESHGHLFSTPATMFVPAALLLLLAMTLSLIPSVRAVVQEAADTMLNIQANHSLVLKAAPWVPAVVIEPTNTVPSFWNELLTIVIAAVIALWCLFQNATGRLGRRVANVLGYLLQPLRAIHTGRIGDYVAWFVFGIAAYAGLLFLGRH